jgi:O-glycosyl hydrolase
MLNVMGNVPAWMGGDHIEPGAEDEWVEMIASLLVYARTTKQLRIDIVSPMNETDLGQNEGPSVRPDQYARLLHTLSVRLDNEGLGDIRLLGPDTASLDEGLGAYLPALAADAAVMAKLDHIGLHDYHGNPGGAAGRVRAVAPGKTVWITEFSAWCGGCDTGSQPSDNWAFARGTVEYLLDHIEAGAASAQVYDAYDSYYEHHQSMGYWGLIGYDEAANAYLPRKRFWAAAQVMKFVSPGMIRIGAVSSASQVRALAFRDEATGRLTIVGQNAASSLRTLAVSLSGVPEVTSLALYQTSATLDLARGADAPVVNNMLSVRLPADSFFTLTSSDGGAPAPLASPAPPPPLLRASTPPAGTSALVGETALQPDQDANDPGMAEAFEYTASASGTASRLFIYLDRDNAATAVAVGLYSNTDLNSPDRLLTAGTILQTVAGGWNSVRVPPADIRAGTTYWIAVLGVAGGGRVRFRDAATGRGSQTSGQTALAELPASWPSGEAWQTSSMSAYVTAEPATPELSTGETGHQARAMTTGEALRILSNPLARAAPLDCSPRLRDQSDAADTGPAPAIQGRGILQLVIELAAASACATRQANDRDQPFTP